jgi:hypothetical protein
MALARMAFCVKTTLINMTLGRKTMSTKTLSKAERYSEEGHSAEWHFTNEAKRIYYLQNDPQEKNA